MTTASRSVDRTVQLSRSVSHVLEGRLREAQGRYATRMRDAARSLAQKASTPATPLEALRQWHDYATDFTQRSILFWDTLRQRGNNWLAHEAAGKPPVLAYDYEVLADARTFERPANYALVRIVPPEGIDIDDGLRPYVIVDPRAGHGPGIGGFKEDSEVGVALRAGHPVYFVIFYPDPEPGQTMADIIDAEAEFIRIVAERHPESPKPVVIGNCQGGWAVMMLAAARPEITGPLVINAAPMSYWAGNDNDNPMRYAGGLAGGAWLALLASDLGAGKFDGAWLVQNFERLNPANTYWEKYYHLFTHVDTEPERFLAFERWWGGFYLMNEEEIRWIVNNLFVGNKLAQGEARLGPGRYFDLRSIRSPIVVFASMGDNITPPQQAFNWIADVYGSTEEIKANGQTIVALLHQDIGHLGIFVSGQVARKEHAQIVSVLRSIQELPPGLYGMEINEVERPDGGVTYDVTLQERDLEHLSRMQKQGRVDEKPFEAVAALSELTERAYSLLVRPFVRELVPDWLASVMRDLHPLRAERWLISDRNPWLAPLPYLAAAARNARRPRRADTLPVALEHFGSAAMVAALDLYRDVRDASAEAAFYFVYGNMLSLSMADEGVAMRRRARFDPRALPAVRQVLEALDQGGRRDGLARIAMLVTRAGDKHRLPDIERVRDLLERDADTGSMSEDERRRLLQEETIIVEFEPARAKRALPKLLASAADRRLARAMLDHIEAQFALNARQSELVAELRQLLPAPVGKLAASATAARGRKPLPKAAARPPKVAVNVPKATKATKAKATKAKAAAKARSAAATRASNGARRRSRTAKASAPAQAALDLFDAD
jgi:pimeloyl-ACP methyl ester carboxylesterase